MSSTICPYPEKVGICVHCELQIHRGIAGWLQVTEHHWDARKVCHASPCRKHEPLTTLHAVVGLRRISGDLREGEQVIQTLKRSFCQLCNIQIAWMENIGLWSDIFFEDEVLIKPLEVMTWNGTRCPGYHGDHHVPLVSFITSDLQRIIADVQ